MFVPLTHMTMISSSKQLAVLQTEQLADVWMTWAETQTQQNLSANHSTHTNHASSISKVCGSNLSPQSEMQTTGLAGLDSSILTPFREPREDQFLPNTTHAPMDPYSEDSCGEATETPY